MITRRPAEARGHADFGWLKTWHTFSFGQYHDPAHMGFRSLRVINDDIVAPGEGFGMHGHRDMEIVTWVLDGALEHRDSLGTGSVLRPGDIQRMTAGRGIRHSEFNPSQDEPLRLLQIWILPEREGLEPGYEETHVPAAERRNRLRLIVDPAGRDGALRIHQDARIHAALLDAGETVSHALAPGRHAWVQVGDGDVTLDGVDLARGDGAAVSEQTSLEITARTPAEVLLFDLA
jgi:redox-sensitive bicupin YhaK (pirin superfamily)